jgi:hypothetical protein
LPKNDPLSEAGMAWGAVAIFPLYGLNLGYSASFLLARD